MNLKFRGRIFSRPVIWTREIGENFRLYGSCCTFRFTSRPPPPVCAWNTPQLKDIKLRCLRRSFHSSQSTEAWITVVEPKSSLRQLLYSTTTRQFNIATQDSDATTHSGIDKPLQLLKHCSRPSRFH